MADVAALGFSVDSGPIVTATEALENLNNEAQKAPSAVSRLSAASDALVTALNRNVAATTSLTQRLDALEMSGSKTATTINNITNVTQKATDNVVQFTGATNKAKAELDATAAAADKMAAAWSRLGAAGAAVSKMQTPEGLAQFRMSSLSSDGSAPTRGGAAPGASGRLNAYQAQNLFYQGTDVVASLASGMPLTTIALQQGGQIAPTFMGPGGASISGVIGQVTEGIGSLVGRIGLMTGASAAAAAAIAALIVAQQSYASSQLTLAKQLAGTGRLSGLSAADVNAIAAEGGGGLSRGQRRDYAGQLAATGLSGGVIPGVLNSVKDFSATMGQDESSSLQTLAAAFKDPAKGAEDLNKQLGLLDGAALENIQRLTAQGDKLGAQRALLDALSGSLAKHTDLMTGWGRVSEAVLVPIANLWDRIGEGIDKALSGGSLDKQIADLRKVLDTPITFTEQMFGTSGRDALQKQYDDLVKRRATTEQTQQRSQQNLSSAGLTAALKSLNPSGEALQALEDKATAIRRPFMENWLDPYGAAKSALDGLATQTKQMKEDMAAGGAQYADAVRSAQFGLKTVGFTSEGLSVAQINKTQDDKILDAKRKASEDTSTDGQNTYQLRLKAIEEERQLLLQRQQLQVTQSTANNSGSYAIGLAQVPPQYRDAVYNAATAQGNISPDFLASVLNRESHFNPNAVSKAGAKGIAQFTDDTAKGMGLADPFDAIASIQKAAQLLSQLKTQYGGDEVSTLVGYNASTAVRKRFQASGRDVSVLPEETRNYIPAILTPSPSARANLEEQQQRTRQLEQEKATLEALKAAGGENTAQYRAQAEVVQRLSEAQAKNQTVSASLTQQLNAEAKARQDIQTATQFQGFMANDNFTRDQLGRSKEDQAAASAARPYQGTSYYDEVYNRTKDTNSLGEAKQMVTDGATSFVTALRRGASASDALASAFGSAADKLLSKVLDSVISSAFGGVGGGGGGIASLFGGSGGVGGFDPFNGFSSGGYTGAGGRYEPAGVVHRGEVVWSQNDVARYGGAAVVERMRLGYPGYAGGGVVGGGGPVTGGNSYTHAPINITMEGSSGDPQKDQTHLDNTIQAFRQEAVSIFAQEQAKSLQTNGTLWKAGVRRAAS